MVIKTKAYLISGNSISDIRPPLIPPMLLARQREIKRPFSSRAQEHPCWTSWRIIPYDFQVSCGEQVVPASGADEDVIIQVFCVKG